MCEACAPGDRRWGGWQPLPPVGVRENAIGPWIDLSHPIGPQTPTMAIFEPPSVERVLSLPEDPANITRFQMIVHQGTHVDAPFHIFADGPAMDAIPLERFVGRGVVLSIPKEPFGLIGIAELEAASPAIEAGDIVFLDTGWANHVGTPLYDEHPSLAVAAAEWLVEKGVKLVGVDFGTPDMSPKRRPAGFTWPVHLALLGRGVLVAEHLANLRPLASQRVEIAMAPLNIVGSDGAPARIMARAVTQASGRVS